MSSRKELQGQFLFDLLEIIASKCSESGIDKADDVGIEVCQELVNRYAGLQFYFPKGKTLFSIIKQAEIFKRFNGHNLAELAIEYGYSEQHCYRIIKAEYESRQGDMLKQLDIENG